MPPTPLRSIGWASARFGVTRHSIYAWVRAGFIPYCRIGRRVLFDEQQIDAFIASGGGGSPREVPKGEATDGDAEGPA